MLVLSPLHRDRHTFSQLATKGLRRQPSFPREGVMCVKRHSAMPPRRIPQTRIDFAALHKALGQSEALLSVRKDHAANENRRSLKQKGWWWRLKLLFAKH
jgi:hypothetical protein